MMEFIQFIFLALFGRLTGTDVGGKWINKLTMSALSGLLFIQQPIVAAIVFFGLLIGHALRDSIFDLLTGWNTKAAIRMTLRASSFLPLMVWVYISAYGLELTPYILLCLIPFTRAPIQYLCKFIPLPIEADKTGKWYVQLFLGKAEMYELIYSAGIGVAIVWM